MPDYLSKKIIRKLQGYNTLLIFIVTSLTFGVFFILTTPLLRGPDEMAHFSRAYQISEGSLVPVRMSTEDNFGGAVPQSVLTIGRAAYDDLISEKRGGPDTLLSDEKWNEIASLPFNDITQELKFPGSASYPPTIYVAPALGASFAKLLDTSASTALLIMRIACLISFVVVAVYSLYIVRELKVKWVFFVAMLTPTALFQASMISTDGFMNALIFLMSAVLIKSFTVKKPLGSLEVSAFLLAAILVALSKPNYAIFALSAMLIPSSKLAAIRKISPNVLKVLIVSIPFIALGAWSLLTSDVKDYLGTIRGDGNAALINSAQQLQNVLSDPFAFVIVFVKTLIQNEGSYILGIVNSTHGSLVILPAILVVSLLLLAGLYCKPRDIVHRRSLRLFGILLAVLACSIFAALYLIYTPVYHGFIDGVQGRYFLPLMPGIIIALCSFIAINIELNNRGKWLFPAGSTLALLLVSVTS